jgi:hypothetical protein
MILIAQLKRRISSSRTLNPVARKQATIVLRPRERLVPTLLDESD